MNHLAIVSIGRNEGDRLRRCLDSVLSLGALVVYVDSGSSDGSAELALSLGVAVVHLDPSTQFTAARARNEGLAKALSLRPELEFVQFVDGDCELLPGWLERGMQELGADERIAATCGRVREINREMTIYNRLCDLEWSAPAGEAMSCGGNALMRIRALRAVGGFNPTLIGGEEPELCLRLRMSEWRIWRSDFEMVRHEAAMTRFPQWWRRALRSGWSYAEGATIHRDSPERPWRRENRRILFWGALLPTLAVLLAWPSRGISLLLLLGYPALAARVYLNDIKNGLAPRDARLRAAFLTLAKFPQAIGQLQYVVKRRRATMDWRDG